MSTETMLQLLAIIFSLSGVVLLLSIHKINTWMDVKSAELHYPGGWSVLAFFSVFGVALPVILAAFILIENVK